MTDRFKGLVVTLDHDIREDDARAVMDAIRLHRFVVDVRGVVADMDDHINRLRILHLKLLDVVTEDPKEREIWQRAL